TRAPAAAASAPVASIDPSSITRISRQGAAAASSRTTAPMEAASLKAGITTDVSAASAISHQFIHHTGPCDAPRTLVPSVAERARQSLVGGDATHRGAERCGSRIDDEARDAVLDELERAAGIMCRDDRFAGEERLERHVAIVFVVGREHDGERAGVEGHERGVVDRAGERDAAREAGEGSLFLELRPQRSIADDDKADPAIDVRQRGDDEVYALVRFESSH